MRGFSDYTTGQIAAVQSVTEGMSNTILLGEGLPDHDANNEMYGFNGAAVGTVMRLNLSTSLLNPIAYGTTAWHSLSLTTIRRDDGAVPGEYRVTVDDRETDQAALKAEADKLAAKKGMEKSYRGAMIPQDMQAKASKASKSRLPGSTSSPTSRSPSMPATGPSNSI